MDAPKFIEADAQQIIDDMIAQYEDMTGRVLQPAQVERLLINAFAYREYLIRSQINDAATMNLVDFSRSPFLDYLGALLGVRRLTATNAACNLHLNLVEGHGAMTIPAGVRVQSLDGQAVFATDNDVVVTVGVDGYDVSATCLMRGNAGNGYAIGAINIILDPQPYLLSASNTDATAGGADAETDDELRDRIKLAPQSFSNAGSIGAYKYFAKSANPGIIDVSITSPVPGEVHIFPLMEGGELPNSEVLAAVLEACNAEKVRPLTDTVIVDAPTVVSYAINVDLTLINGTVATDAINAVTAALNDYTASRMQRCGLDIVLDKVIQICMIDGVYSVDVSSPEDTLTVDNDEVAKCTGITVTVGGYSDE